MSAISRRQIVVGGAAATLAALHGTSFAWSGSEPNPAPLREVGYDQVRVLGELQVAQAQGNAEVLMSLAVESLIKPFREMAGKPGTSVGLGGWYEWNPDYDYHHSAVGLAPGSTLGQWMSALARMSAAASFEGAQEKAMAGRVSELVRLVGAQISAEYFAKTRFPGYSFDKLVCGLMDAHRLTGDTAALPVLGKVRAAAETVLPGHAVDREFQWKVGKDLSWMWDETYTLPENLYLVSAMGGGTAYRRMAEAYLDDATYFEPLSRGVNVLADKHAYSYVNALCSAMQAYLVGGSDLHRKAAENGFAMLEKQSFATGGWGPDEVLRRPGFDEVAKSLTTSHNSFETPCGSYAQMKLTRYLLRASRDGKYGDSMERVMVNTVLGALPLRADGSSYYSSDYNVVGKRVYSVHRWPCCSGTLPQVVADYGINTYLREDGAVWVNLYQPSELRWTEGAKTLGLRQTGSYLEEGRVEVRITSRDPARFAMRLRIPAWAGGEARLRVNGQAVPVVVRTGFATVERLWRAGDRVELELPMTLRLEELPSNGGPSQSGTVALMVGPLVLFALRQPGEAGWLQMDRGALLEGVRTGPREWTVKTNAGERRMVPFIDVGDREYSTYVKAE